LELNGEPALGMVATGTPEVVIDSSQHKPPGFRCALTVVWRSRTCRR